MEIPVVRNRGALHSRLNQGSSPAGTRPLHTGIRVRLHRRAWRLAQEYNVGLSTGTCCEPDTVPEVQNLVQNPAARAGLHRVVNCTQLYSVQGSQARGSHAVLPYNARVLEGGTAVNRKANYM